MKRIILSALMAASLSATAWAQKTVISNEAPQTRVYDVVEQMPHFPGGPAALFEYLSDNIKYPQDAVQAKQEGRVIVSFVVDADGSIVEPRVVKSVSPSFDAEALRIVSAMPRWTPGMQGGQPVRVRYTVPISFKLTSGTANK